MSEQQNTLKIHRLPFTQVPNDLICSNKISGMAKALWCVFYSKPDNWTFYWREIENNFKEGRDAVRNAAKQLEELGYLKKTQKKINSGKGMTFGGMEIELFSCPSQQIQGYSSNTENPYSRNPDTSNSYSRKAVTYKDGLKKDKNLNNTNSTNKDLKSPLPPTEERGGFKKFEGGVNKLVGMISDKALDLAKKNAPGWSIYYLMEIYIEGIEKRGLPDDINKAFPSWCIKYTKGKRPN